MKKRRRPIDKKRDSAAAFIIGTADDDSRIEDFVQIGGALYTVKLRGIYRVQLADEIDPERMNPDIPNSQQRVLKYGSESELVARTLLTAKELFNPNYMPKEFDHERAKVLAFDALKDLVGMDEDRCDLQEAEENAIAQAEKIASEKPEISDSWQPTFMVPHVDDIERRCKGFLQKADHALIALFGIAKLFYGADVGKKWFESVLRLAQERYGGEDSFTQFLNDVLPFLKLVRAARNCVEHPTAEECLKISDFCLRPDNVITPPSIEIIHPESAEPSITVRTFMAELTDGIALTFESMVGHLCAKHAQPFGNFPVEVMELPPEHRGNRKVRLCYGMWLKDRLVPAS